MKEQETEAAEETAEEAEEEAGEGILHRKVGAARFFELLGRDFASFYRSSFLFLLGILPGFLLLYFGAMAGSLLLCMAGGLLGGLTGSPLLCGMLDTVFRTLRDEPGYWWHTYKKAWRQNWKQSLPPGAVTGLLLGAWVWVMVRLPDAANVPVSVWICEVVGLFMLTGLGIWFYSQLVLVDLDFRTRIKNSVGFFFGFLPRTIVAAAITAAYWTLILLYLPYTVVVLMVTGVWLPVLLSLMCVYPALNRVFSLEKALEDRRNAQLDDMMYFQK